MAKKDTSLATNRKARHNYFVDSTIEAGLVLKGTEVKSIRRGKVNIADSYAIIKNEEVFVEGMHVSPYEEGNIFNVDPLRRRKLLLNRAEIRKLKSSVEKEGFTLIPLKLYLVRGRVKMELGVCKGKKEYDKRDTIAKRDSDRRIRQALKLR